MAAYSIFSMPRDLDPSARRWRRHALARLAVAWLAMMQVMMLAWPGYLRRADMAPGVLATLDSAIVLMNWASLVLTVPVMLYSVWPVWRGAAVSLRKGRIGMDVPVALGLLAAFVPSVVSTWSRQGHVYFDSATMFGAFLLTARYLELCARQSTPAAGPMAGVEALRPVLVAWADRLATPFIVIQLLLTVAAVLAWQSAGGGTEMALAVAVAMLVISCPCAMAMAVPTAMAAARAVLLARPDLSDEAVAGLQSAMIRKARGSLLGAMAWHLLLMPLAMLGWMAPQIAALTMLASSLAVAGNAWALRRRYLASVAVHALP
ncbi:hypothetical protein [Bordetella sp. LUAb4]|uniref:P-type ATPase n=1 Tax=Bordetella sp. LUAb4 TaxID=2843195 RepID=UPI001E38B9C7|nr:hypothetical protein [Bordetella sp. LUAb4]